LASTLGARDELVGGNAVERGGAHVAAAAARGRGVGARGAGDAGHAQGNYAPCGVHRDAVAETDGLQALVPVLHDDLAGAGVPACDQLERGQRHMAGVRVADDREGDMTRRGRDVPLGLHHRRDLRGGDVVHPGDRREQRRVAPVDGDDRVLPVAVRPDRERVGG